MPIKTLEFKLSFTPQQQRRIDDWMLVQKWVWNRGLGLIEEFGLWNPWDKQSKQYVRAMPACYHDAEKQETRYGQPVEWKMREGLLEGKNEMLVHPVRIAEGQPPLTRIDYFGLLSLFAHKWHKERQVTYSDRTVSYADCPSKFISGTVQTLADSHKAFLGGVRKFPKFKKARDTWDTLINNNSKEIKIEGDRINIPKLGYVKVKGLAKRWPKDTPFCPLKICRKASGYYLQLTGEVLEVKKVKTTGKSAGLDPGNQYVYSDDAGHQVEPPTYFIKQMNQLAKLQRRMARQFRANSYEVTLKVFGKEITVRKPNADWQRKNYRKTAKRVAKLHERISRQRRAFNHFHSTKLVGCYDELFLEDFQSANLGKQNKQVEAGETTNKHGEKVTIYKQNGRKRKTGTIRKMRDNATGQLWAMIEQKASSCGKTAIRVPSHYTSQTCPKCDNVTTGEEKKKLSDRFHKCKNCGYEGPRDVVAAQVIKLKGLEIARTGGCTEKPKKERRSKAGRKKGSAIGEVEASAQQTG